MAETGLIGSIERPSATGGRLALYFVVRYLTPVFVLAATAASTTRPDTNRLTGVLTAQMTFALATHALAIRGGSLLSMAIWLGIMGDIVSISALVVLTGGASGPLVFLFTIHALAAGILLSSRAGVRVLLLATVAIIALDVAMGHGVLGSTTALPRGLEAVAALWIIGGGATLFSTYNERELRRRTAELATVRRVTLDIEDSLTLEDIFKDLSEGVVDGFGFDGAAVLLRNETGMRCVGAHGITGAVGTVVEERGRIAHALALGGPLVTSTDAARRDGALLDLIGPRGYVAVPIADDGLLIATRAGRKRRPPSVRAHEVDALNRLAHHARLAIANARMHARVAEMAITDPLTGLANHGEFQRRLQFEVGRLQRYATLRSAGHRLSVILLDIDHFKRLNDRYGHPAGDAVLKGVAAAVKRSVRSFDVAARYGGEEFAVILPETGVDGAREVADRIRRAVMAYPFAVRDDGKPVRVTLSAGVATAPENGATAAALVKLADAALYRSKEEGRNRVNHAVDRPEPIAKVVPMEATRRRRAAGEAPARAVSRRARGQSSRPKRRTPRA